MISCQHTAASQDFTQLRRNLLANRLSAERNACRAVQRLFRSYIRAEPSLCHIITKRCHARRHKKQSAAAALIQVSEISYPWSVSYLTWVLAEKLAKHYVQTGVSIFYGGTENPVGFS